MRGCPGCGRELPEQQFPFCPWCGQPLANPPVTGQRKTVTVLFADLVDSTVLGSSVDPEVLRGLLAQYWDGARSIIEAHGGTVEKFIGDAVVGVFGIPTVHEDDALRAARAAGELVQAVAGLSDLGEARFGVRLAVRVGVNTGEVFTGDGAQTLMSGDTANVAARLQTAAEPGQVLLGESTFRLVRDATDVEPLGPLTLKGKAEPVAAYRLTTVRPVAQHHRRRRFSGPMLGRDRQLVLAESLFATVRDESSDALLTVIGDPGVGKSRLVDELLASIGDEATVLFGGCLPYGESITFAPLAQVASAWSSHDLRALLGDVEHADRIVAGLQGLAGRSSSTIDEMVWAFRRLVEVLAASGPVALVVDDLQWGEPALVDLVRDLVATLKHRPVLVVVMARPELLVTQAAWPGVAVTQALVVLSPLSTGTSQELASRLLGPAVPEELARRVSEAAEGMPLFVEETVAMLVDEGALVSDDEGWTVAGSIDEVPVPGTVRALLAARLDRLSGNEREVIEAAAVVGRTFYRDAVLALSGSAVEDPDESLASLVRSDLVQPTTSDLPGQEAFAFSHSLTAETAYASLPKNRRVTLHLRMSRWLHDVTPDTQYDGLVAFHLEQAASYQEELGISDPATRAELATLLVELSQRANALGDAHSAVRHAERAVRWEPSSTVARLAQSRAAWHNGDQPGALAAAEQAQRLSVAAGDRTSRSRATVWWEILRSVTATDADPQTMLEVADRAAAELQGDDAGLADACRLRAEACNWLGRMRQSAQESMTALDHELRLPPRSRRVGDLVVAAMLPLLFGDMTLAEGEERLARLEAVVGDDPASQRGLTDARQWMTAARGDVDVALAQMREQAELLLEQGSPLWAAEVMGSGMTWSYVWTGELTRAVDALSTAIALKRDAGEIGMRATWLAELSVLLARLRRFDEAEAALAESRAIVPVDDIASVLEQASTQGLLAAAEGDPNRVRRIFDTSAHELRRGSEMSFQLAQHHLCWAQACAWLDDRVGEDLALHRARALLEQKGFPVPIAFVDRLLAAEPSDRWPA